MNVENTTMWPHNSASAVLPSHVQTNYEQTHKKRKPNICCLNQKSFNSSEDEQLIEE